MEEKVVHFRGNYVLRVTTQEDEGKTYEQVEMRSGVTVIPINASGHITAILEYDWYLKEDRIKLVTAYVNDDETPLECAKRELAEETGISAKTWTEYLVSSNEEGAVVKLQTYFIARNLERGKPHPDPDEKIIEIDAISPQDILEQVLGGMFGTTGTAFVLLKLAHELIEKETFDILSKETTPPGTP